MTDNVIDLFSVKKQKEAKFQDSSETTYDLHKICTEVVNEVVDSLYYDFGLDTNNIECSAEMFFFFESFKSMLYKCVNEWHPFQDISNAFMLEHGITIEPFDGGYRFVMEDNEDDEQTT